MSRARSAPTRAAHDTAAARVQLIEAELESWRSRAVPDPHAPLGADDVARLVRDCFRTVGVDPAAGEQFSVNTVHYYRRKDILDEPEGKTSSARYTVRHVWQAAGARLAGFLGLVTLAEARDAFHGADDADLRRFVAARVADARGRHAARAVHGAVRPASAPRARPLQPPIHHPVASATAAALTATVVPLGGNAMCLIPASHAALVSAAAARSLVDALAAALGLEPNS